VGMPSKSWGRPSRKSWTCGGGIRKTVFGGVAVALGWSRAGVAGIFMSRKSWGVTSKKIGLVPDGSLEKEIEVPVEVFEKGIVETSVGEIFGVAGGLS
jgi:hypothetical protein